MMPEKRKGNCPLVQDGAIYSSFFVLAAKHSQPLGDGKSLRQRLYLELLHYGMSMRLDRSLRRSEFVRNLLVQLAAHDQSKNLAFPWR
jgi:hypothetical protein